MNRYEATFARLREAREGAFVPFAVLGNPTPKDCLAVIRSLAVSGADILELGIPFSDPVADGPTIQRANERALAEGMTPTKAWDLIRTIRREFPELPIGLLIYANLVESAGMSRFFADAAEAGVDSVLLADVPTIEIQPYAKVMQGYNLSPVLIAAPNTSDANIEEVARISKGFTYVVSRFGVTGADDPLGTSSRALLAKLRQLKAPPPLLGFGVSRPEHVEQAMELGAAGAICGSALVSLIERHLDDRDVMFKSLESTVAALKAATRIEPESPPRG